MSKYKLLFNKKWVKELKKIPKQSQSIIKNEVHKLSETPTPSGCKKLNTSTGNIFRIRCGDYRVVYEVQDKQLIILVIEVAHRKDIYLQ